MQRRAFVRISCNVIDCCLSDNGFKDGKIAEGEEIHQFLTRELGLVVDPETKETIPRDHAVWYLGCNQKAGALHVNEIVCEWNGESSWDRVVVFLNVLYQKSILTIPRYVHLISIVEEGMNNFKNADELSSYLRAGRKEKPWAKKSMNARKRIKHVAVGRTSTREKENEKSYS